MCTARRSCRRWVVGTASSSEQSLRWEPFGDNELAANASRATEWTPDSTTFPVPVPCSLGFPTGDVTLRSQLDDAEPLKGRFLNADPASEHTANCAPGTAHAILPSAVATDAVADTSSSSDSAPLKMPENVQLEELIGSGGFARVWRGRWMHSNVAVKVMRAGASKESLHKFCREARTLRTLRHPNICYFFDTCLVDGAPVIVLELLTGGTLGKYLGIDSPSTAADNSTGVWSAIASSELLQMAQDVASGLAYLHANGVTHRDVKRANVMVQAVDHVPHAKLCDFGISALKTVHRSDDVTPAESTPPEEVSCSFSSIGTPRYQAPELTRLLSTSESRLVPADQLHVVNDARVDVYSYGLLLHEILHGCVVFSDANPFAAAMRSMAGHRPSILLRPEHTRLAVVIEACWHDNTACRPSMEKVVKWLHMPNDR